MLFLVESMCWLLITPGCQNLIGKKSGFLYRHRPDCSFVPYSMYDCFVASSFSLLCCVVSWVVTDTTRLYWKGYKRTAKQWSVSKITAFGCLLQTIGNHSCQNLLSRGLHLRCISFLCLESGRRAREHICSKLSKYFLLVPSNANRKHWLLPHKYTFLGPSVLSLCCYFVPVLLPAKELLSLENYASILFSFLRWWPKLYP